MQSRKRCDFCKNDVLWKNVDEIGVYCTVHQRPLYCCKKCSETIGDVRDEFGPVRNHFKEHESVNIV